jgi:hypothetical protein
VTRDASNCGATSLRNDSLYATAAAATVAGHPDMRTHCASCAGVHVVAPRNAQYVYCIVAQYTEYDL